jgi:ribosomal protein S18 acetylase RimI-like enzyme
VNPRLTSLGGQANSDNNPSLLKSEKSKFKFRHMSDIVTYRTDVKITTDQFIDILNRSTLAERRPINDRKKMNGMVQHGNIFVTAWVGEKLVGVSRAFSDFSYCCYLADLAVDEAYQKQGIGKKLISETHAVSGLHTTLILLAAPKAAEYYPKIGMERFTDCFLIRKNA